MHLVVLGLVSRRRSSKEHCALPLFSYATPKDLPGSEGTAAVSRSCVHSHSFIDGFLVYAGPYSSDALTITQERILLSPTSRSGS